VCTRLQSCHGDSPPSDEDLEKEVDFQVQQAANIQELYNSLGESSKYVNIIASD
jgi:hypothetical protein